MKQLPILIFLLLSTASYCQYNALSIPDRKQIQLKKINEWNVEIDSLANRVDSSLTSYFYDTLGYLIEKKYDFNRDFSKFISVKYKYNEKGFLIDSIVKYPYHVFIRSSFSFFKPDSMETFLYDYSSIKKIFQIWKKGESKELDFNYGSLYQKNEKTYFYFTSFQLWVFSRDFTRLKTEDCFFCIKDNNGNIFEPIYNIDLIDFISIKTNGVLTSEVKFEYEFIK